MLVWRIEAKASYKYLQTNDPNLPLRYTLHVKAQLDLLRERYGDPSRGGVTTSWLNVLVHMLHPEVPMAVIMDREVVFVGPVPLDIIPLAVKIIDEGRAALPREFTTERTPQRDYKVADAMLDAIFSKPPKQEGGDEPAA